MSRVPTAQELATNTWNDEQSKPAVRLGHPFFYEQTQGEIELHDRKNHDYSKGGHPLGNFYRVGTILGLYPGLDPSDPVVLAVIYALKQWDAMLWGLSQKIEAKVEGAHERLQDVSIYAKIARCILKERESSPAPGTIIPAQ